MSGLFLQQLRASIERSSSYAKVIGRISGRLNVETKKFSRALDIECGTAQSSVALLSIAEKIVGVDGSQAMLDQARRDPQISHIRAAIECLIFAA